MHAPLPAVLLDFSWSFVLDITGNVNYQLYQIMWNTTVSEVSEVSEVQYYNIYTFSKRYGIVIPSLAFDSQFNR